MGLRERKAKNDGRKLHNEEIHYLNTPQVSLGDKMNKDGGKGARATYDGDQIRIRGFVWETSRKEPTWLTWA
jgi:hypothetical protein